MSSRLPKAILLDLDDTVLAFSEGADPCWRRVCHEFAPRLEGVTAGQLFDAIAASRNWFWSDEQRHRRGRLQIEQARREIVAAALQRLGVDARSLVEEIAVAYMRNRDSTIRPFPGAIEALRWLRRRGVRLALITNGEGTMQRGKIERFGLASLFDCILIEGEVGLGKPDERMYRRALEQMGVGPEEAWMVGDNLAWDVLAPQKLGIAGIWLDYAGSGLPADSQVRPDRIIRSLAELVDDAEAHLTGS